MYKSFQSDLVDGIVPGNRLTYVCRHPSGLFISNANAARLSIFGELA